jgi:hypothetical protein
MNRYKFEKLMQHAKNGIKNAPSTEICEYSDWRAVKSFKNKSHRHLLPPMEEICQFAKLLNGKINPYPANLNKMVGSCQC